MRPTGKKAEIVLLLLPVVLLVGVGMALRSRGGALLELPDNRFRLTVNNIAFYRSPEWHNESSKGGSGQPRKRARPLRKNEEKLRFFVFVDHKGDTPNWWRKEPRPNMDVNEVVFTDKQHKQVSYPCFLDGTGYNLDRRYVIHVDCYVPKSVSLQGSTLTATAWVAGAGKVRFRAPVASIQSKYPDMFASTIDPEIQILDSTP